MIQYPMSEWHGLRPQALTMTAFCCQRMNSEKGGRRAEAQVGKGDSIFSFSPLRLRSPAQRTPSVCFPSDPSRQQVRPLSPCHSLLTELDKIWVPAHLKEKIRTKALESSNSYVRYLAARTFGATKRTFRFSSDDDGVENAVKQKIENDPDPLVRYSLFEHRLEFDVWSGFHDPETFFDLPHEARLAIVRTSRQGGRAFAELISHAVDHQLQNRAVSETEIWVSEPSGDLGCLSAT